MDLHSAVPPLLNVAQLEAVVGDDPLQQREFLALYVGTSRDVLAAIERAIAVGDSDAVRRAAHKLRGASATVGAEEAAALSAKLVADASQGILAGGHDLCTAISRSVTRLAELANGQ